MATCNRRRSIANALVQCEVTQMQILCGENFMMAPPRTTGPKQQQQNSIAKALRWAFFVMFGLAVLRTSFSSCKIIFRQPGINHYLDNFNNVRLNQTLMRYSLQDPWTPAEIQKLNFLLQVDDIHNPDSVKRRWQKNILGRTRAGLDSYRTFNPKARKPREKLPLELVHPRYLEYWAASSRDLLAWLGKKKYEPQVMNELLSFIREPLDKHLHTGNNTLRPYRDCAVVGNSGILLNRSYGPLIDNHEMVIRLNNARIAGFEQYVGSRTTLSFVNSNILTICSRRPGCSCHPYGADVPIVAYVCQALHFVHFRLCSALTHKPILVTDSRFDVLCMRIVKYYSLRNFFETKKSSSIEQWRRLHDGDYFHYSSGMQAIVLALGICDKVDIFGFGKSSSSKHHYHTNQKGELDLHDYEAEYMFYNDLANERLVPFLNEAGFKTPFLRIFS